MPLAKLFSGRNTTVTEFEQEEAMSDFVTLSCPHCGGKLEVSRNTLSLVCQHCGTEHLVRREEGSILLEGFARCPVRKRNDRVEKVSATKNEAFLLEMLETDAGARYVGEFAIGTNFEIDRFTKNILFDEKIGGTFHMALGAGYPDTGSKNKSAIHWDMICDMRKDSEILVDGEIFYRNGEFAF